MPLSVLSHGPSGGNRAAGHMLARYDQVRPTNGEGWRDVGKRSNYQL